jgi:GDP-L-fucose synthase
MNKIILITGCSGLVGTHLTNICISRGYKVIGTDIKKSTNIIEAKNFIFAFRDLTKDGEIEKLLEQYQPDAVFNCFGIKGSPLKAKNEPVDFLYPSFKINTEIINQCSKRDIWLVFVSSVGVYAPAEKFVEDSVWKTLPSEADWFPSWSKRMGEILLEAYKIQYGYNKWTIVRPANIFGEYDDFTGNGTVIGTMCKKVYEATDYLEVWGDGTPTRDFVYAADVAEALLKVWEEKIHDVVNFGSGETITIESMIKTLLKIAKKDDIELVFDTTKPNGDLRRQMDTKKQKKYKLLPIRSFECGLGTTYDYYINSLKKQL